jgi:hypothetical protein
VTRPRSVLQPALRQTAALAVGALLCALVARDARAETPTRSDDSAVEGSTSGEPSFLDSPPFPELPITGAARLRPGTLIVPDADVGAGHVTLVRSELTARASLPASEAMLLRMSLRLSESRYRFGGDVWGTANKPGLDRDPDLLIRDLDLHVAQVAIEGAYRLSDDTRWFAKDERWALLGTAYTGSRWEDHDFHSGLGAGAAIAFGYEIPDRLRIALGVSVRTPLVHSDFAVGPFISLRWRPTDYLTIRSRELGAQIEYAIAPALDLFIAGFRSTDGYWLNDRGALGALTFRDRQLRFGTGFNWTLANWLRLQVEAGAIAERRMRVHDEDFGDLLSRRGDPAGFAEIRFEIHL